MPIKEKDIQRKMLEGLREIGCYAIKIQQNQFTARGTPDILCCYRGRFFGIEVKRPGGKPTKNQIVAIDAINASGGCAFVATCWGDVAEKLYGKD